MKPLKVDGVGILALGVTALILMIAVLVGSLAPTIITNGCAPPCLELHDLSAQFSMAQAAWAMVVVSLIGTTVGAITLIVVYQTLIAARASAEASKEAVEVADRNGRRQIQSYVEITEVTAEITSALTKLHITVKNFGQSPARNVQISANMSFDEGSQIKDFDTSMYLPSIASGGTEATGRTVVYNLVTGKIPPKYVSVELIWKWADVFGDNHEDERYVFWNGDFPPPKNFYVFSFH